MSTGELLVHQDLEWRAILEHIINRRDSLQHSARNFCRVRRLLGPVLGSVQATLRWQTILRTQLQRRNILKDEISGAGSVKAGELSVYAVDVVGDGLVGDLTVVDEGVVAEVVGADKDGVDSRVHRHVQCFCAIRIDVFAVSKVGREFVAVNVREKGIDAGECARSDIVAADCSRYSVIVDVSTGVLSHVLRPRTTTVCRVVVCWADPSDRRCAAVMRAKVSKTRIVSVAVSESDQASEFLQVPS